MADSLDAVDHYAVLGLEAGADEKEVARAYKKKSLRHHPDRGGDVEKFLELKKSRDYLLDPVKKKKYDEILSRDLMARKRQLERDAELAGKRKKMRDDQIHKEYGAMQMKEKARDEARRRNELNKLREKTAARQRELQDNLDRQARRQREVEMAASGSMGVQGSKAERTITLKWDRRKFSHSDESIIQILRQYGEIESVKLKSSSAKVVFTEKLAAVQAVRIEGHSPAWREVRVQGHVIDSDVGKPFDTHEKVQSSMAVLPRGPISLEDHLVYELEVLEKLRRRIDQDRTTGRRVST